MQQSKLSVVIGRFQPFHDGHLELLKKAAEVSQNILVLLGSTNSALTFKNPWTASERKEMIKGAIREYQEKDPTLLQGTNIIFGYLEDRLYNDTQWCAQVQSLVSNTLQDLELDDVPSSVTLIGHHKDDSSYYLNLFPNWDFSALEVEKFHEGLDATTIRETLFKEGTIDSSTFPLANSTVKYVNKWRKTNTGKLITNEYNFTIHYKKQWDNSPYPPMFNCSDAVVFCGGHVLLVTRKTYPGKGLYALPGGFISLNESGLDSAVRELKEETKLKVPVPVLKGSIIGNKVFDHPQRSLRGRTFSHAFAFNVKSLGDLPKVKGSDDAKTASWIPVHELPNLRNKMFEDHADIINHFLGFL